MQVLQFVLLIRATEKKEICGPKTGTVNISLMRIEYQEVIDALTALDKLSRLAGSSQ